MADNFGLREKLNLDIQEARPVYIGQNAELGLDIWGKGGDETAYQKQQMYSPDQEVAW